MRHFAIVAVISGCLLLGMGLLLSGPFAADTASPIWAPPALSELIQEGIDGNQEIKSLEERVESLKAGISFAGALDDPRLGFAIVNLPVDSFRFDRTPMTQKQIFIAQKFPWFGKLDLKTQREALTVIRQQAVLEAGRWASSGLNSQPGPSIVVKRQDKKHDEVKGTQGAGACLQDMPLAAREI